METDFALTVALDLLKGRVKLFPGWCVWRIEASVWTTRPAPPTPPHPLDCVPELYATVYVVLRLYTGKVICRDLCNCFIYN